MEPVRPVVAAPRRTVPSAPEWPRQVAQRFQLAWAALTGTRTVQSSELIATLNEVADAVSSAMSVDEVLGVIDERAKRITDTDKAVLVLCEDHGENLDLDTIVVRGRRGQHPQEWWESRLGDAAREASALGRPFIEVHAEHDAILLYGPVLAKDRLVGLMCAINTSDRPFTDDQIDFFSVLCAFASSAIENARLAEQSRYVLLASERDRIACEMHDGVVQSLFSISLGLEVCKKQVTRDPVATGVRLDELQAHLNTAMTELRRFIYDLRPMKLAELGLQGAVEYWVREITLGRHIHGHVHVTGETPRLIPSEEACLYRVTKEAVSNAVRHSGAAKVDVTIAFEPGRAVLEIRDDGHGFDVDGVVDGDTRGIGLRSISDRVRREGGALQIESRSDSGTLVRVAMPVGGTV